MRQCLLIVLLSGPWRVEWLEAENAEPYLLDVVGDGEE